MQVLINIRIYTAYIYQEPAYLSTFLLMNTMIYAHIILSFVTLTGGWNFLIIINVMY